MNSLSEKVLKLQVDRIAEEHDVPEIIAWLIVLRGLNPSEVLHPSKKPWPNTNLLPNIDKATARMLQAFEKKERVVIYGDYDVDGITASTVMLTALNTLGFEVNSFLPNRQKEGYGLTVKALDRCVAEHNPDLIITVDCGTTSGPEVTHVQAKGVDIIVTDHHQPNANAPHHATALVNPQLGDDVDLKRIAGVGVAFKLIQAFCAYVRKLQDQGSSIDIPPYRCETLLPFVAIGTIADMVPLMGENRDLVLGGFDQMKAGYYPGLKELAVLLKLELNEIRSTDISFKIAPTINAAGRINNPLLPLSLLTMSDNIGAAALARQLNDINLERKAMTKQIESEAMAMIGDTAAERSCIVLCGYGWNSGILGLVAGRIVEKFNRPTILLNLNDANVAGGSARSVEGFNLLEALNKVSKHLLKYGGHHAAAGLSLHADNYDQFKLDLEAAVLELAPDGFAEPIPESDLSLDFSKINEVLVTSLDRLEPYGRHNPVPVFNSTDVKVASTKVVGENHLKIVFEQDGKLIDGIWFSHDQLPGPESGTYEVFYELSLNKFRGNVTVQLMVKELILQP